MSRIPMKGDPEQFDPASYVQKYGDPADFLAVSYFDCLARAENAEAAGERAEAAAFQKLADRSKKELKKFGRRPKLVEGKAAAVAD